MDYIKATVSAALYPWRQFWRYHQLYLDKTVLHLRRRWLATAILASIFALRVIYLRGFYAVAICLSIYKLCKLTLFVLPYPVKGTHKLVLPIKGSDEFQPFIGRLTEFQLWYVMTKAYTFSIIITFFSICDVVFIWPYLLYFFIFFSVNLVVLNTITMIRYRYLPFTIGKHGIRW